jgi:hypothetical protein
MSHYDWDKSSKIRTIVSICLDDFIFDINIINHSGWGVKEKYNTDELEIVKRLKDSQHYPDISKESYNIKRIRNGYWDHIIEMYGENNEHSKVIGIHLALYKEAIARFDKIKAFM